MSTINKISVFQDLGYAPLYSTSPDLVCALHNSIQDNQEKKRREKTALADARKYRDIFGDEAIVCNSTRVLLVDSLE